MNVVLIFSDFSNLDLYVRELDKEIMWATLSSLFFAIVLQTILVWQLGIYGAALGALLSALFLWYMRSYMYKKFIEATVQAH